MFFKIQNLSPFSLFVIFRFRNVFFQRLFDPRCYMLYTQKNYTNLRLITANAQPSSQVIGGHYGVVVNNFLKSS